ncbi:S9 family peptidase [Sphingobacterium faecale]|uniref:S9 family peptidase n=1 Tax=Sphingobacterium faecale TaxID=2803775 RepID=A0ABS1R582_9SPHI|nr:prolyl oligopeptidase family serine peptidase [Sphingobacterium faecale]MBL1409857.1 S9 family peptidase [Sphingobacterium faecale]
MRFLTIAFSFLLVISILGGCNGQRKVEYIPVQDFFSKPDRFNFRVSPNGRYIAYLGLEDHCRNIFVLDIEEPDSSKQLTYQDNMNVQYFFWISPDSIVFSNTQSPGDSLRIFTIDIHQENPRPLLIPAKHELGWLSPLRSKEGSLLAEMNIRDSSVFDLYRVPLDGSGPQLVEVNPGNISSWYASSDGKVRLALTSDSVEDQLLYRRQEGEPYQKIVETDFATTVLPLGPVKGDNAAIFALSNVGRDKLAIVKLDLNSGKEEVVAENEDVDMNREGYSFSRQELIYTARISDKKEIKLLNKDFKKIYSKITNKFNGYNVDILDMDSALNTVLFKTYTDINPGGVYYYSKTKDKIVELSLINPALADKSLAPMKEVSFNSRDGKTIKGYLTRPLVKKDVYPVVVLIHDGPNRRDVWGFNSEVQFLANRGYAVFQINYRGSVGYGKDFYTAGFKQWGGEIQNDISDGVAWLIHQGIADKNRIAIMGTGFGGYSALYAACFNPTLYKCAISASGYTNLFTYLKEIPPYYQPYLQLYYNIIGDPTREYELFKAISPLFHAEKVRMPILMFHGGRDRFNSLTDVNQFVQKVKNNKVAVKYVFKEDEGRRFKKDENVIEYYQMIEQFLKEQL